MHALHPSPPSASHTMFRSSNSASRCNVSHSYLQLVKPSRSSLMRIVAECRSDSRRHDISLVLRFRFRFRLAGMPSPTQHIIPHVRSADARLFHHSLSPCSKPVGNCSVHLFLSTTAQHASECHVLCVMTACHWPAAVAPTPAACDGAPLRPATPAKRPGARVDFSHPDRRAPRMIQASFYAISGRALGRAGLRASTPGLFEKIGPFTNPIARRKRAGK